MVPFFSYGQDTSLGASPEIDFIIPAVLSSSDRDIARIRISNTTAGPLNVTILGITGSVNARNPAGGQEYTIQPGEEKYFPVYLKIPAGNTDSIHSVRAEIQLSIAGRTWLESVSRQIEAERTSRIVCTVPDEVFLAKQEQEAQLQLHISNQGNTFKSLIIELDAPRFPSAYPNIILSLSPGEDTVLTWNKIATYRQLAGGELHYYLTVKDQANTSRVYFYQLIKVLSLQSSGRPYIPAAAAAPNTIGLRYEQWGDIRYYSMTGNGQMAKAIGDYNLRYRFDLRRHPFHNAINIDQIKLEARNEKNIFRLGDIYFGQETGLYNRGIQAKVNLWGNIFLDGAYTHSGFLPSAFYNFRKEETIAAGIRTENSKRSGVLRYIYQNDRLLHTNTHLLFAGSKRKLGEKGDIEAGIGLSAEKFERKADYDGSAFFNLNYRGDAWAISSQNRYSGPAYPFINRGATHFRQSFTYMPSNRVNYHAEVLLRRFSPRYRYLQGTSTPDYRNNRGSVGISVYRPNINYRISAGAGSNMLFAPYINNSATYRNHELFMNGEIHFSRPHLSIQLKQEVSRIIPRIADVAAAPAYFAGLTELNTVFYNTYLSFYLNKGALAFYDQANYVLNGFSRDIFLARLLREFHLRPDLSLEVSADHYEDRVFGYRATTFGIAPEFRYKSFQFNYEAGYRLTNGTGAFLQSLSIFKHFGNPLERKHSLRVQAFNDTNGNGLKDTGEMPVEGIMLGIGPIRMVTDENGFAGLKNLPREKYELLLLDKQHFSSPVNKYEILLGSSQTVPIPLHEGMELLGNVQTETDELTIALNTLIIRVTDTETGKRTFLPCDHAGNFKTALRKGKTYHLSVEPATMPETYIAVPEQQIVHTAGSKQKEIRFILKERERNIIRKQFGNP